MIILDFMPKDIFGLYDIPGDGETLENCEPACNLEKTK